MAYLSNVLYGIYMGTVFGSITTFFAGLCLNVMAYMDDLGKHFADLDIAYEQFEKVGKPVSYQERKRYLHVQISKGIQTHYKILQ